MSNKIDDGKYFLWTIQQIAVSSSLFKHISSQKHLNIINGAEFVNLFICNPLNLLEMYVALDVALSRRKYSIRNGMCLSNNDKHQTISITVIIEYAGVPKRFQTVQRNCQMLKFYFLFLLLLYLHTQFSLFRLRTLRTNVWNKQQLIYRQLETKLHFVGVSTHKWTIYCVCFVLLKKFHKFIQFLRHLKRIQCLRQLIQIVV